MFTERRDIDWKREPAGQFHVGQSPERLQPASLLPLAAPTGLLQPARSVHTIGMRFPIDVAFCDRHGVVLRTLTVAPWRVTRVVWRAGFVVEAPAGSFDRWQLRAGDTVEVRE